MLINCKLIGGIFNTYERRELLCANISSSFTVQNSRTRLAKIDHVRFGYLATTKNSAPAASCSIQNFSFIIHLARACTR